jgi:hypothetical protein
MAKSNLLKEAIADAKAVKETALANARLALEEAFAPRIQSMLSHKLAEELDDEEVSEEEEEMAAEVPAMEEEDEMSADAEMGAEEEMTEEEDEMYSEEDQMDAEEEMDMAADSDDGEEYDLTGNEEEDTEEDDLDLEAVIRELEDAMASDDEMTEEEMEDEMTSEEEHEDEMTSEEEHEDEMTSEEDEEELDINEIIRTLKEMEGEDEEEMTEEEEDATEGYKEELEEAYKTIQSMRKTINEVNLLNAKLLYTNKLFRTFDLNESQKVKVIENFDRAANLREVKLVFATLGENLNVARKKKTVVKESLASKPMKSTAAPRKILSEGDAVAERFKKLAGLIK